MRALVIGGSGLFGKKTCLTLLQDPDFEKVVALDVAPPPATFLRRVEPFADRFQFVAGDISRLEHVMNAAHTYGVDHIVNWAMILSQAPNPRLNTMVGCLGACNVWEAARLLGIKRVVYASSETVYGEQKDYGDRDITEQDRLLPFTGSFYALAKCLAEVMAGQYHELYGIESTALRPAIGYGHGGKDPKFVRWFSEIVSLPAVLATIGGALPSFLVRDLAWRAALGQGISAQDATLLAAESFGLGSLVLWKRRSA